MAYSSVKTPHVFEYQKAMEEAGKRIIADCSTAAHAAGIEFDSKCVSMFGRHIYDVIEEAAKEADLIVIGTHGRRGVRRLLLGSVAEGFMRVSSKPVLLIRGA
jgi:nucleotide-binding universal stress UspA family protein